MQRTPVDHQLSQACRQLVNLEAKYHPESEELRQKLLEEIRQLQFEREHPRMWERS